MAGTAIACASMRLEIASSAESTRDTGGGSHNRSPMSDNSAAVRKADGGQNAMQAHCGCNFCCKTRTKDVCFVFGEHEYVGTPYADARHEAGHAARNPSANSWSPSRRVPRPRRRVPRPRRRVPRPRRRVPRPRRRVSLIVAVASAAAHLRNSRSLRVLDRQKAP